MTQPTPNRGGVWQSRYQTGVRATITDTDDWRVQLTELDPNGQPHGRGRWTTLAMLHNAWTQETP